MVIGKSEAKNAGRRAFQDSASETKPEILNPYDWETWSKQALWWAEGFLDEATKHFKHRVAEVAKMKVSKKHRKS